MPQTQGTVFQRGSHAAEVEQHTIRYKGDLKVLSQKLMEKATTLSGGGVVEVVVEASRVTTEMLDDLRSIRRLVKQLPCLVVAELTAEKGQQPELLDLMVAMLCDVVQTPGKASKVCLAAPDNKGANAQFKESLAADMWHLCTGGNLTAQPDLDLLDFAADSKKVYKGLAQLAPHYWMALRNCGMARPGDQPPATDAMQQWQLPLQAAHTASPGCMGKAKKIPPSSSDPFRCELFNCYFTPKVMCLFAAWDSGVACPLTTDPEARQVARAGQQAEIQDGHIHIQLTSDILLCSVDDMMALVKTTSDVLRPAGEDQAELHIVLKDGLYASSHDIFPAGVTDHMGIYKWHRKWEQFVGSLRSFKMACTVVGTNICQPLMELFLGSEVRNWESPAECVTFGATPHMYTPGPSAMRHLVDLPIATLRRFLLTGLPVDEAHDLGLVSDQANSVAPFQRRGTAPRLRSRMDSLAMFAMDAAGGATPLSKESLAVSARMARVESTDSVRSVVTSLPSMPESAETASFQRRRSLAGTTSETPTSRRWKWAGDSVFIPPPAERTKTTEIPGSCALLGYGLATPGPEHKYTQEEVCDALKVDNPRDRSILTAAHIKTRYLADLRADLEDPNSTTPMRLAQKQRHWAPILLADAIKKACKDANVPTHLIAHLSISCSSGYMLPGLTAYVVKDKELGIPNDIDRKDIVGMGCHAGLNSLKSAAAWAAANPGQYAISCGVEVLSASYVWGQETKRSLNTVIVNSLFGDGCFAAVLRAPPLGETIPIAPAYINLPASWWGALCVTDALEDMIYEHEPTEGKIQFLLSELAPYHVGQALFHMMGNALRKGIPVHEVDHVISHTGGKTVLDCTAMALGLDGPPANSLPFTLQALSEYGNQSSASFLFAFDNLVKSGVVCSKDRGLFVTMGPGAGFEMAMWTAGDRFPDRCQASMPQELSTRSLYAAEMLSREVVSTSDSNLKGKGRAPRSMGNLGGAIAGIGATAATTAAGVSYMSPPMALGSVSSPCFGGIAAFAAAVAAGLAFSYRRENQDDSASTDSE